MNLNNVERIGNKYIFKIQGPGFEYLSNSRIEYSQCFITTDLNFNVISINLLPSYIETVGTTYRNAFLITDIGEVIYATYNRDDFIFISKYDVNGNLKYVHQMNFNKYNDLVITAIHQISASNYVLIGHGVRFGQDIVAIKFDESSVPSIGINCQ